MVKQYIVVARSVRGGYAERVYDTLEELIVTECHPADRKRLLELAKTDEKEAIEEVEFTLNEMDVPFSPEDDSPTYFEIKVIEGGYPPGRRVRHYLVPKFLVIYVSEGKEILEEYDDSKSASDRFYELATSGVPVIAGRKDVFLEKGLKLDDIKAQALQRNTREGECD